MENAVSRFGRIDILANVAGITTPNKKNVEETTLENFNRVISINLAGTFLCVKHAVPAMKSQHYGRIVNVASIGAFFPSGPGNTPYAASKGGIIALAHQLVQDLSSYGITVNTVAPGVIRTPMVEQIGEARMEARSRLVPVARLGKPEEVAAAIAFLASDDASFVNGHMLVVDGGMTTVAPTTTQ